MSNADPRGKFVWHELLTSDTAGAGAFYPKVVSWKSQPWDKDPSYSLWMTKGGPIGGLANLQDSTGNGRWVAYVGVDDVHAAVAQAKSMGAKVVKDATDIPGTGTYAMLSDPQGAEFAIYKSSNPSNSGGGAPGVGEFSWHELATSDPEGAVNFYSKLFGWGIGPKHDMGPEYGHYHLMLHGGEQFVGIFKASNSPPGWMCYVRVDDAGKAANAAKSSGGRVINGPMEVPGGTWIAQILDPAGVAFAVHELKGQAPEAAKPASKPKAQKPAAAKPAAQPEAAKPAEAAPAAKPAAKPAEPAKPAAKPAPSAPAAKPAAKKAAAKKKAPAKKAAAKKAVKKAAKKVARKAAGKKAAKKAPAKKKAKAAKRKK